MPGFLQDLRYAFRMLAKHPGFTSMAVLTLALGIGANTAIFTVVNELLLKPRPGIGRPGQLVDVGRSQDGRGFDNMSYPNYADYRDRNRTFSGVLGYIFELRPVSLSDNGTAERIYGGVVSGNYFSVLEAKPALGRFFAPEEDKTEGARPVTVLSYSFWKRRFAGDPGAIGREIKINGQMFTIIGVASQGFRGTMVLSPDAWFPMMTASVILPDATLLSSRSSVWMLAIGRLKPGVSIDQARADLTSIANNLQREYPRENEGRGVALSPSRLFPGELQPLIAGFMTLLMVIVGLVLLIACVNVAGMLLVRSTARRREVAVRLAIGASGPQLLRQFLTEGWLLFVAGGAAGLLVAVWMRDLLLRLLPQLPEPVSLNLSLDGRVLTFTLLLSSLAGVLSSLVPAFQALRPDLVAALKDEVSFAGVRKLRLRSALTLGQVAISLLLLICAGLFVRALDHASRIDPGFDPRDLLVVKLDLSLAGYQEATGTAFADQLLARVGSVPGVTSASLAWGVPLDGGGHALGGVKMPGQKAPGGGDVFEADWNVVTPSYLRTMRIPLLRGREFTERDVQGGAQVAIINETMAHRFWPSEDPVGRRFTVPDPGGESRDLEIVGVVRDQKYRHLGDKRRLFVYVPFRQNYLAELHLVVRTLPGATVLPGIRRELRGLNPYLPIIFAQSMREYAGIGMLPQRIAGWVAGSLGLLGLLLTGVGIYSITAFSVEQRTREIGVRMALGASRRDVLRLVLRQGLILAVMGVGAGSAVAFAATRFLSGLLFGLSARDPVTFAGVALLILGTALVATLIPALHAVRVDPMAALRHE